MPGIQVQLESEKDPQALWDVIADFPNIAEWNTGVKVSHATSDETGGVGATRHCGFGAAGALHERVLEWEEPSRLKIEIEEAKRIPIKTAEVEFTLTPQGSGTLISVDYQFTPKGGPLSGAIGSMMKPKLAKGFEGFLDDWNSAA